MRVDLPAQRRGQRIGQALVRHQQELGAGLFLELRNEEAVAGAKRCIELVPQSAHCLATLGAALGQLNRTAEALIAVGSLMRAAPDFSLAGEVAQLRQTYRRDDDVAHFADGLRKAGVSE